MIENNKFEKSFGPVGTTAGMVLFIAGIVLTYFYFTGLILILIGAFVGFSSTSALIDYGGKRVKFCNNIFGIIRTGKWIPIEPSMKIGIKKSNQTYRAYSRGNRALDVTQADFRLVLCDSQSKEIIPMKKFDSFDAAKAELETMGDLWGLTKV